MLTRTSGSDQLLHGSTLAPRLSSPTIMGRGARHVVPSPTVLSVRQGSQVTWFVPRLRSELPLL